MSAPSLLVHVENVRKSYILGKTTVDALRGVSLSITSGEFLAISGPSGSGKTTLLNIIGCIERPSDGRVLIDNTEAGSMKEDALADLRSQKLSFVFQNFNLFPVLTALENVEYALVLQKVPAAERRSRAVAALEKVRLGHHLHHRPMELSGGQRQRVAIARAVVTEPRLVLADEPTANLDHATGEEILDQMAALNKEKGITFVFSTHDPKVMNRASRIVNLFDGLIK